MSLLDKRGVSRWSVPPDVERFAILGAILRQRVANRLIQRDNGRLSWDAADVTFGVTQERRTITWDQARRIADGEDWARVV